MYRRIASLAALILTAVGLLLVAADKPRTNPPAPLAASVTQTHFVNKVYSVADLVVPIPTLGSAAATGTAQKCCDTTDGGCAGCLMAGTFGELPGCDEATPARSSREDTLMKLIKSTVTPAAWSEVGGSCKMEYFPVGMALVVHAPADVQERVAAMLESLRKLQDVQIAVELRFVTVPANFFERVGVDFEEQGKCQAGQSECKGCDHGGGTVAAQANFDLLVQCPHGEKCAQPPQVRIFAAPTPVEYSKTNKIVPLTDKEVCRFLEAVQSDPRTNVLAAPKLTVFNGQAGKICCGDEMRFVTGMKISTVNGQNVVVPENKSIRTGLNVSVLPTVSADGKHVSLQLQAEHTELASPNVPLHPVTTFVTPKLDNGLAGPPVPFTQFVQQPQVNTVQFDGKLCAPDGGTMLLNWGTIERERRTESSVPYLNRIPYLGRLFRTTSIGKETDHLLMLVTPRILTTAETCEAKAEGKGGCVECDECKSAKACSACAKDACAAAKTTPKCCEDCTNCKAGKPCCDCCKKGCCKGEKAAFEEAFLPPARKIAESVSKSPQELRNEKLAAKLVDKYHKAIAEGDLEKARKCARQAVDLDPACFAKPMAGKAAAQPSGSAKAMAGRPETKTRVYEWDRPWSPERPTHLTPDRVHGGIE